MKTASIAAPEHTLLEQELRYSAIDQPLAPLPETEWPVPGLLAPGLALLTGPASSGKSLFAQHLAFAISEGAPLCGHFPTRQGTTLHLSFLNDTDRLKRRAYLLRSGQDYPDHYFFSATWQPDPNASPLASIREFLEQHSDMRLVILDHLTALQGQLASTKSAFAKPLMLINALKDLAHEYNILILVLDRQRSVALTSICDTHLRLQPLLPALGLVSLRLNSSEADEQLHHLSFDRDSLAPALAGPADTIAALSPSPLRFLSPQRHAILDLLYASSEALTPATIAAQLNTNENATRQLLFKLCRAHLLTRTGYGHYMLSDLARRFINQSPPVPTPETPDTSSNSNTTDNVGMPLSLPEFIATTAPQESPQSEYESDNTSEEPIEAPAKPVQGLVFMNLQEFARAAREQSLPSTTHQGRRQKKHARNAARRRA